MCLCVLPRHGSIWEIYKVGPVRNDWQNDSPLWPRLHSGRLGAVNWTDPPILTRAAYHPWTGGVAKWPWKVLESDKRLASAVVDQVSDTARKKRMGCIIFYVDAGGCIGPWRLSEQTNPFRVMRTDARKGRPIRPQQRQSARYCQWGTGISCKKIRNNRYAEFFNIRADFENPKTKS